MKRSETTAALSKALAAAQLEMRNPAFDSMNPHFKNNFLSLAGARDAVIPVFAKHGISVCQELTSIDGAVGCLTVLNHESGEFMEFGPLFLPVSKSDAQGFGSAATYCKRYTLLSVAGIVGDVDDDANAATGNPASPQVRESAARTKATKDANKYANRIVEALNLDLESAAADVMREAKGISEEFAADVWHALSTPIRNRMREISNQVAA